MARGGCAKEVEDRGRDGVITQHYHTLYIVSTAHGAPSSRRGLMLTRGRDLVDHVRSN